MEPAVLELDIACMCKQASARILAKLAAASKITSQNVKALNFQAPSCSCLLNCESNAAESALREHEDHQTTPRLVKPCLPEESSGAGSVSPAMKLRGHKLSCSGSLAGSQWRSLSS